MGTWTDTTGSQTATIGTEHVLISPTASGTYEFGCDVSAHQNGDVTVFRVYNKYDGTNYQLIEEITICDQWPTPGIEMQPFPLGGTGCKFTLQQIAGTGRSFKWSSRVQ